MTLCPEFHRAFNESSKNHQEVIKRIAEAFPEGVPDLQLCGRSIFNKVKFTPGKSLVIRAIYCPKVGAEYFKETRQAAVTNGAHDAASLSFVEIKDPAEFSRYRMAMGWLRVVLSMAATTFSFLLRGAERLFTTQILPNLMLLSIYAAIGYFLWRTQIQQRREWGAGRFLGRRSELCSQLVP